MRSRHSLMLIAACGTITACEAPVAEVAPRPALTATEVLRIGSVDDPESALTAVGVLRIGPDGRIYTLHRQESAVRIHGPDGTPLGSFGGNGDGPGEFRTPNALEIFDDEALVYDFRTSRTSYFDLDGAFLRSVSYLPPPAEDPRWSQVRPNGLLRGGFVHSAPRRMTATGWETLTRAPLLRLAEDGSSQDTILHYSLDQLLVLESGDQPVVAAQPFPGSEVLAVSGDRMEVVVVDQHRGPQRWFRVTKIGIGADTLWRREYGFEPALYDEAVVDSFVTSFDDFMIQRTGASRGAVEAELRAKIVRPPHLPVASSARIGRDGSVWIELSDRDPTLTRWLVLEADGDPVGEVGFSQRFTLREATVGAAWGMLRDDLDVPYIVRYEIRPEGS